jgi:guanylate kinase
MSGNLVVVSGPSGVGKSTVVNWVREHPGVNLWVSVSMTTRPMRDGETHGVEYYFVTRDEFEATVAVGEMLEWAEFAGNLYGTPAAAVAQALESGTNVLLEIEIQGARQVKTRFPDAKLVFLTPPSWEELVSRLTGRGTESAEVIEQRLEVARYELSRESEFDFSVVSSTVEETGRELLRFANTSLNL